MKCAWIVWTCVWLLPAGLTIAGVAAAQTPSPSSVATGGKLYDTWWKAVPGVKEPVGDHSLWALQSTNKQDFSEIRRADGERHIGSVDPVFLQPIAVEAGGERMVDRPADDACQHRPAADDH